MVAGSGDGTQSRQEARLGLQPLTDYAGTSFTIGRPSLRKNVIDDAIRFDAERVLNDLGSAVSVVAVDRLLEKIAHGVRLHLSCFSSQSRLSRRAACSNRIPANKYFA